MFEFFKRIRTVVSAELHHLIDQAEDPVLMAGQYLREMSKEIQDAEKAAAKMMAEEKLLGKKLAEVKNSVQLRGDQALESLRNGREDLARRALEDKKGLEGQALQLEELHQKASQHANELKEKLKVMKAEFRELELKRDSLKARAESAQARSAMNKSFGFTNPASSRKGFERLEEKVIHQEAEAEASEDFYAQRKSLDHELKEIKLASEIDLELKALKEQLQLEKTSE